MSSIVGLELPEGRKLALESAINQLRIARKGLLIAGIPSNIEDRVHDMITDCIHHLQPIADTCIMIRVRADKKEDALNEMPNEEAAILAEERTK